MRGHRWGALLATGVVLGLLVGLLAGPAQAGQRTVGGSAVVAQPSAVGKAATPPKPVVKRVRPATGPTTGGTVVKIKGRNFVKVKKVLFGKTKGTRVRVKNSRKVVVVAPPHAPGTVPVRVVTRSGKSRKSRRARFTYLGGTTVPGGAPVVTSLTPSSGPVTGGTVVDITGTGLAGATAVAFGGVPATFAVLSGTVVRATSPAHAAGSVPVTVQTSGGTSVPVSYTYVPLPPPPLVVAVDPLTGPTAGGTAVTITGIGFNGATEVSFGGTAATTFSVSSDTSISATTPAHDAGLVSVSVTTPGGTSTVAGLFTYTPLPPPEPVVVLVTPATGSTAGGTEVTITGTGFTGATAVSFGGTAATFTVDSDTSISATTPAHAAGLVSVSVTTPAGTSTVAGLFTYTAPPPEPVVVLVTPATGSTAGGTEVTITGTGFTGATAVSFGGTAATFTVDSDTSISATTPAHALGLVSVSVTTPGGTSTVPGLFLYVL
jgi:hypothetical protein